MRIIEVLCLGVLIVWLTTIFNVPLKELSQNSLAVKISVALMLASLGWLASMLSHWSQEEVIIELKSRLKNQFGFNKKGEKNV